MLTRDLLWSDGPWGNVSFEANWGEIAFTFFLALASITVASGLLARSPVALRSLLGLSVMTAVAALVAIPYVLQSGGESGGTGTAGVPGAEFIIALALIPVLIAATWTAVYLNRKRALYIGSARPSA